MFSEGTDQGWHMHKALADLLKVIRLCLRQTVLTGRNSDTSLRRTRSYA